MKSERRVHSLKMLALPSKYQGLMAMVKARQRKKPRFIDRYLGHKLVMSLAKGRTFSKTQEKRRE